MKLRLLLLLVWGLAEMIILGWLTVDTSLLVTLAVVIGSGFIGTLLAKRQGAAAWRKALAQMSAQGSPADQLLDGLMIFAAAVLLILPGIIGDVIGLLLLLPPVRRLIRPVVAARLGHRFQFTTVVQGWSQSGGPTDSDPDDDVIDAESFRPAGMERFSHRD